MQRTSLARFARIAIVSVVAGLTLAGEISPARGGDEKIVWEPVDGAQVKIDDKVPLAWNVFTPSKKDRKKYGSLALVLLGHRYLLLDMKTKIAYEIKPGDLQKDGSNFESADLRDTARQIPSIDWNSRDVGPEELIQCTLNDYGRRVSISIPHPPDLRAFY
ncbi:MAG TPA: hypothetical protein VMU43_01685 [Candidatus Acidoferrum sp.]|nr:hypothetical protein [Candidatus Acidoferrum sp.]